MCLCVFVYVYVYVCKHVHAQGGIRVWNSWNLCVHRAADLSCPLHLHTCTHVRYIEICFKFVILCCTLQGSMLKLKFSRAGSLFFFWRLKKPIVACVVMCKVDTFFTILQPTFQHPAVMCNTNVIVVCVVMCKVDPFSHYYTFYDTAAGLSAFTCFYSACSENTLVSGGVGSLLYGCRPFKIHMSLMHVRAQA